MANNRDKLNTEQGFNLVIANYTDLNQSESNYLLRVVASNYISFGDSRSTWIYTSNSDPNPDFERVPDPHWRALPFSPKPTKTSNIPMDQKENNKHYN